MKNTLSIIQTVSKVGKILSKIVFICCVIGFAGCLLGAICLAAGLKAMQLGGVTIHGLIEEQSGMSVGAIYTTLGVAAVICGCESFVAKKAELYFGSELRAGTPFTFEGADQMKQLGIICIVISLCVSIFAAIVYAVVEHFGIHIAASVHIEIGSEVGTGLVLLLLSLVFRHGAEIRTSVNAE